MLTFRLHLEFTSKNAEEAAAVLRSLVGPVRSEPGCCATRVHRDAARDRELLWVAEWREIEDFEKHLRGPTFRRILAVIEMASAAPIVEIDDVNSRRGFDLIEEILGPPRADRPEREAS